MLFSIYIYKNSAKHLGVDRATYQLLPGRRSQKKSYKSGELVTHEVNPTCT